MITTVSDPQLPALHFLPVTTKAMNASLNKKINAQYSQLLASRSCSAKLFCRQPILTLEKLSETLECDEGLIQEVYRENQLNRLWLHQYWPKWFIDWFTKGKKDTPLTQREWNACWDVMQNHSNEDVRSLQVYNQSVIEQHINTEWDKGYSRFAKGLSPQLRKQLLFHQLRSLINSATPLTKEEILEQGKEIPQQWIQTWCQLYSQYYDRQIHLLQDYTKDLDLKLDIQQMEQSTAVQAEVLSHQKLQLHFYDLKVHQRFACDASVPLDPLTQPSTLELMDLEFCYQTQNDTASIESIKTLNEHPLYCKLLIQMALTQYQYWEDVLCQGARPDCVLESIQQDFCRNLVATLYSPLPYAPRAYPEILAEYMPQPSLTPLEALQKKVEDLLAWHRICLNVLVSYALAIQMYQSAPEEISC